MDDLSLLSIVSNFSIKENRKSAALNLANFLHCEDICFFIFDKEIKTLLPAPGFIQTLRPFQLWREFFIQIASNKKNISHGKISFNDKNQLTCAIGIPFEEDVVVLIGGNPLENDIYQFRLIAPVLLALFKTEQDLFSFRTKIAAATRETEKAEQMAKALEGIRNKLNLSYVELRKKNEQLIKINNELDSFIYTASHDLKAPISNIEGLMYSLSDMLSNSNTEEADVIIKLIHQSIQRFKNTLMDLTEISKVQNIEEEEELIYFGEIIAEIQILLDAQIKESGGIFYLNLNVPSIRFSKKNLRSILYNFISNALKYRANERIPEVRISTILQGDFILLKIVDNGLGIRKELLPKLFTMFKRFHDHVEGTGLGLYIVKKIIDNAGGKIEIISQVDKGTEFNIFLRNKFLTGILPKESDN